MSNYGSYPGSQEPWPGRQPQEPYGQPSDPWGDQDPWGGTPASSPPGGPGSPTGDPGYYPGYDQGYSSTRHYEQGYAQTPTPEPSFSTDPSWSQPAPQPPRKRGNAPLIALIVVLAILVLGGGTAALIKLGSDDGGDTKASRTTEPTTGPTGGAQPSDSASPASSESSQEARFVKVGQCVVNKGSDADPQLEIAECGDKTFEVLARFDGTVDYKGKCQTVTGYQFHYFFDSELDTLDFVLCLKRN